MYSMLECDTVIYVQQCVQYVRVWYSDLYIAKCTVCKSVIQWSICTKVYSMLECDTVIYMYQSVQYVRMWYSDLYAAMCTVC